MSLSHEITRATSLLPLPASIRGLALESQARYLASALYGRDASPVHLDIAHLALLEPRVRRMAPAAAAVVRDTVLEHGPDAPPPFLRRARVIHAWPLHRLFGDVTVIGSYLAGDVVRVVVGVDTVASWQGGSYRYRFSRSGAPRLNVSPVPQDRRSEAEHAFHFLMVTALLEDAAGSPLVTGPPDMPAPQDPLLGLEPWLVQRGRLRRDSDARWTYHAEATAPRALLGGRGVSGRA